MTLLLIVLIAVILVFAAALFAVRTEELRRSDRRQVDLPVAVERRKGHRRQGGNGARFRWKVKSLQAKVWRKS